MYSQGIQFGVTYIECGGRWILKDTFLRRCIPMHANLKSRKNFVKTVSHTLQVVTFVSCHYREPHLSYASRFSSSSIHHVQFVTAPIHVHDHFSLDSSAVTLFPSHLHHIYITARISPLTEEVILRIGVKSGNAYV